jgi:tetratricopeptide (TPR) repeat protein
MKWRMVKKCQKGARRMVQKVPYLAFCCFFFLCAAGSVVSQTPASGGWTETAVQRPSRLQQGIRFYSEGRWREAVIELRRAQAEASTAEQRGEALYWIGLAELSAGDYEAAVQDMEALERGSPASPRLAELPYHKGRAYYYLGRYDEAVVLLKDYSDRLREDEDSKKSAALYWIGECLYSQGQLDKAQEIFTLITEQYPHSAKFEAASYRIGLINQKKIEVELLTILQWSHEESLKTIEDYQQRERSYDQALIASQKRIADMLKDTRLADLENANAEYRRQLAEAEARISFLEESLKTSSERTVVPGPVPSPAPSPQTEAEKTIQLLDLKAQALELRNDLEKNIRQMESPGTGGTSK